MNDIEAEEARAFLKQIYARLDITLNGNGQYDKDNFLEDLENQFKKLVEITKKEKRVGMK
ncbi:hypothetical protein [Sediminibacillus albus]|uniref:hypothetical protein n=1 Tax=Sediminibacillus albus TaxID=407036 RepID=UPI000B891EEE|nr:hypothetical protein [Sediminibacillus albus]